MKLDIFAFHAGIMAVAVVIAYFSYMRTQRVRAAFMLYRTRDRFIYLVASGVLSEESVAFRHYYSRINQVISAAPNVGLDDLLQMMLTKFKPEDFQRIVAKSEEQVKKLKESKDFTHQEVRDAASDYYSAMSEMILAHSSILRAAYLFSKHSAAKFVDKLIPSELSRGLEAVDYAEREARLVAV